MNQTPSLTPSADAAQKAFAIARERFGARAEAMDPEGVRIRAGLAVATAIALGAAELDDLHIEADEIEGRMLNAMASGLVTLLVTLGQGDNQLAGARLPNALTMLFLEAGRQLGGSNFVTVETDQMRSA